MDIHQSTVDYLSALRIFDKWREMGAILRRSASGRPRDWHLPIIACQAVSGSPEQAIPASAALACTQIGIILTDDMLDDDPRGEYHRIGHGRAANYAIAFQAAGAQALIASGASIEVRSGALKSLSEMMSVTAYGQELDVQNPSDEISYWRIVENKSAPFYGCAFHLGALFGHADTKTAPGLQRLGEVYGEMIQIHDDLNDTMAVPANPDWLRHRKPLPILFALTVNHPDRVRFAGLFEEITSGGSLQEAQEILIRSGAVSYCVDQLLRRHREAVRILGGIKLPRPEGLEQLIREIIAPIAKLFEVIGVPAPGDVKIEGPGYRVE